MCKKMGPRLFLCVIFLACLCQMQGSSAVTHVFVKKGDDVLLNVKEDVPEDFLFVVWKFNQKDNVVIFSPGREPPVSSAYRGRVEFSVKDYSVNLKNLQKADSGVYTAQVTEVQETKTLAEYNITVQDPVSPVKLTVDSESGSSVSCNLTVTCSTLDSRINSTFRCNNRTCSQEGGERPEVATSGASLRVYVANGSITCNHSNQVSWTKAIKTIENLCIQPADPEKHYSVTVLVPLGVVIVIIIFIGISRLKKKRTYETENTENTVYADPQVETTGHQLNQSPTDEASGRSLNSTYCLVGHPTGSVAPTEINKTQPESVYAQVQKPRIS